MELIALAYERRIRLTVRHAMRKLRTRNLNPAEERESPRFIAIDLFSGCGGLTEGLRQAHFKVIGAVDVDSLSVETYRSNHTAVHVWEKDIRNLSAHSIMQELNLNPGDLDLLAGCPPCQGFSSLRTQNGARNIVDDRNDLVFDFLRFVVELKPKAIMMENVPGLAKDHRMANVWAELQRLGYSGKDLVLDAADYGVPQRRRRMILIAGMFGPVPFASPSKTRPDVASAIRDLPSAGNSGNALHDYPSPRHSVRIRELIDRIPRDGGSRSELGADSQLNCHLKCDGFKDVYGRMAWNKVAPTITGGCFNPSKGRFLHPELNRVITLREAALLQTFPIDYSFSLRRGRSGAAALIGNALPPEFIRQQAMGVRDYLHQYST